VNSFQNKLNIHAAIGHTVRDSQLTEAVAPKKLEWANVHESAKVYNANSKHLQVRVILVILDYTGNNIEFFAHLFLGNAQNGEIK